MQPTARSLARTYSDRVYPDPWEKVEDYRRVQEYIADHPNAGRTRVGNILELPPSRVRGWIGDTVPDPVRGINTAIDHGWLDPSPDSEIARNLVILAAHVIGGGSISKTWVPAVTVSRQLDADQLQTDIETLGVKTATRHAESDSRATEVVPRTDGSVLGRCLVCMGVPQGTKTTQSELPHVLDELPDELCRAFLIRLFAHRAVEYEDKSTTRLMADRPLSFHEQLADLIRDVTGESVTVDKRGVTVSANAVRALGTGMMS
jgi:hypothetical protein